MKSAEEPQDDVVMIEVIDLQAEDSQPPASRRSQGTKGFAKKSSKSIQKDHQTHLQKEGRQRSQPMLKPPTPYKQITKTPSSITHPAMDRDTQDFSDQLWIKFSQPFADLAREWMRAFRAGLKAKLTHFVRKQVLERVFASLVLSLLELSNQQVPPSAALQNDLVNADHTTQLDYLSKLAYELEGQLSKLCPHSNYTEDQRYKTKFNDVYRHLKQPDNHDLRRKLLTKQMQARNFWRVEERQLWSNKMRAQYELKEKRFYQARTMKPKDIHYKQDDLIIDTKSPLESQRHVPTPTKIPSAEKQVLTPIAQFIVHLRGQLKEYRLRFKQKIIKQLPEQARTPLLQNLEGNIQNVDENRNQ